MTRQDDDVFETIAAHYLCNYCDGCPFYDIAETCDSVPLNCKWLVLHAYFSQAEEEDGDG